jgi:hypothetical protein
MQIVNLNSKAHPLKQQTYIFNLKKGPSSNITQCHYGTTVTLLVLIFD